MMNKIRIFAQSCYEDCIARGNTPTECRAICEAAEKEGIKNPLITGELAKLSGAEFLNKFIGFALSFGFLIAAIVFFFIFISGGIRWITSGGDKDRVGQARGQITNAIIGLLLTFALYAILGIIEDFFGISLRQFNLPKLTD